MDVDRLGLRRNDTFRHAEAGPAGGDRQHVEAHPSFRDDDGHQRRIAAMSIQEDELADALAVEVFGCRKPAVDGLIEGEAFRALHVHVFGRIADRLDGQECDGQILRKFGNQSFGDAFGDQGVGFKGQVRAVLLVGTKRQDGDPVAAFFHRRSQVVVMEVRPGLRHLVSVFYFRYGFQRQSFSRREEARPPTGGAGGRMSKKDKSDKDKGEKKNKGGKKKDAGAVSVPLTVLVTQLARTLRTRLSHNLADSGLYAGQDGVMQLLGEEDGITPGALAQRLGVKAPTMTRTIGRMEAQGFVMRRADDKDARLTKVYLTEEGRNSIERIAGAADDCERVATKGLSGKEVKVLARLLVTVEENLRNDPERR